MPKKERDKGKRGEREVVELARAAGFRDASRSWQTPQHDGDLGGVPGYYIEVRRREAISVLAWANEVEAKAKERGTKPVVAFRRSSEPWRACVPLEDLFDLIRRANGHADSS